LLVSPAHQYTVDFAAAQLRLVGLLAADNIIRVSPARIAAGFSLKKGRPHPFGLSLLPKCSGRGTGYLFDA